jgi:hypothetical protein
MGYATEQRPTAPAGPSWISINPFRNSTAASYWFLAFLLSVIAGVVLLLVFREQPIPPGGDPGNWVATALAFIGRPYPPQLIPLAYPPVLFPLLGAAIVVAGSTVGGVELFAGALMVAFGLSTAALAAALLRTRVVALTVVVFLLADPAILAMFFWGAYPNLLGFVFLNLALVGLMRAGRGLTSSGALMFWIFFALATLTHSLVGLVLGVTTALYLALGLFIPLPAWGAVLERARQGALEAPAIAARALFSSRGGRVGLVLFAFFVGGYYGYTYFAGIPHPYYLASNPVGFRLVSIGGAFQAILPNVVIQPALVVELLIAFILIAVLFFAGIRDRRPQWLTAPVVLLMAWPLAVALLILGGFLAQVVTDYHRFGFFFIVPVAMALGYLLERGWLLRPAPVIDPAPNPPPESVPGATSSRRSPRRHLHRPAFLAIVAVAVLLIVLDTATVPAIGRDEAAFTKVGHDAEFTAAIHAIQHAGTRGGILTIAGADKWARGLTGMNSYAPYSTNAFLFYPSQELDSQLAYYALTSHYAITNGLVATSVRAVTPSFADGVPAYSVYVLGTPRETLRLAPADFHFLVTNESNGTTYDANLTSAPIVLLPATLASPMTIAFSEPEFHLAISVSVIAGQPEATVALHAQARAGYVLHALNVSVTPPTGTSALAWTSTVPGSFYWTVSGYLRRPLTFGNVTPASALKGATDFDSATGGPAALLSFTSSNGTPIAGAITFTTPAATTYLNGVPAILSTPAIWQSLGVRFVLMRNESVSPSPAVVFPDESPYLALEYGLPVIFANNEWSVLEIPVGTGPPVASIEVGGAALGP